MGVTSIKDSGTGAIKDSNDRASGIYTEADQEFEFRLDIKP